MAALSEAKVVLYHAKGCHLCERARGIVAEIREQIPFLLEEVEIDGEEAPVWAYLYQQDVGDRPRVATGRWDNLAAAE